MTAKDWRLVPAEEANAHWRMRARQVRNERWRENALVLLVAIPLLLALNAAWILVALITGHWWFAL